MATDVERLIVSLEASTAKYERALAKANGETDKRVRAMQSRFDGFGAGIAKTQTRIAGSLAGVGRAFGALGIALTTTSIIAIVRRQIIWRSLGRGLAEYRSRPGVDVMRRAFGAASADAGWSGV